MYRELANAIETRAKVATINPDASYDELTLKDAEYKNKISIMEALVKKQLYLTEPLRILPRALPKGAWLVHLSFRKNDENDYRFDLEGYAFAGDSNKEFEMVNQFVSNLRESPDFEKYFKAIDINSLDRKEFGKGTGTNFSITCKN